MTNDGSFRKDLRDVGSGTFCFSDWMDFAIGPGAEEALQGRGGCVHVTNAECVRHVFEDFSRENAIWLLCLVVCFVVEEAVAANSMDSNTFNPDDLLQRINTSRQPMAAKEIVAR